MKFHYLLKAYEYKGIETATLQEAIDQHDSDHLQQCLDKQLPHWFE